MGATHTDVELEALCRGLLQNAAARRQLAGKVEPEAPSVEYRAGFAAGREAGEMAALALALGALTGESPTDLIDNAVAQAAVDAVFPVEFHTEEADDSRASTTPGGPLGRGDEVL